MTSTVTGVIARRLELLHDEYRDRVNAALDEGREDLAAASLTSTLGARAAWSLTWADPFQSSRGTYSGGRSGNVID